jgi:hypothetical protein
LLTGSGLYNPDSNRHAEQRRGSLPWDALVQGADTIDRARPGQQGLEQPPMGAGSPAMVTGSAAACQDPVPFATTPPALPMPGTIGAPVPDRSLKHP